MNTAINDGGGRGFWCLLRYTPQDRDDAIALALLTGMAVLVFRGADRDAAMLPRRRVAQVTLELDYLLHMAFGTVLHLFAAHVASLLTLTVATLAGRSRCRCPLQCVRSTSVGRRRALNASLADAV